MEFYNNTEFGTDQYKQNALEIDQKYLRCVRDEVNKYFEYTKGYSFP